MAKKKEEKIDVGKIVWLENSVFKNALADLANEKLLTTFAYDCYTLYIKHADCFYARKEKDSKWYAVSTKGKATLVDDFSFADSINENVYAVRKNSKWALIDANTGEQITDFVYDTISGNYNPNDKVTHHPDLAYVRLNGKQGVISADGKDVIPSEYDIVTISSNMIELEKDGLYAAATLDGKIITDFIYDKLGSRNSTLLEVSKGKGPSSKHGIVSVETGKEVVPCEYAFNGIKNVTDTAIVIANDGKFGAFNAEGKLIVPFTYKKLNGFYDGYSSAKNDEDKFGLVNLEGKEVIPFIYDDAKNVVDGVVPVKKGQKWGAVNTDGDEVIPFEFDDCYNLTPDSKYIKVAKDGKYGLIDAKGEVVVPLIYPYSSSICDTTTEGVRRVRNSGVGFVDKKGQELLSTSKGYNTGYYELNFTGGVAKVASKDKWGIIDKKGNEIIPCTLKEDDLNTTIVSKSQTEFPGIILVDKKSVRLISATD